MTQKEKNDKLKAAFDVYETFESDFDFTQRHSKSYAELMWDVMQDRKVTYRTPAGKRISTYIRDRNHFSEVTGLGPSTYDRIKSGWAGYTPSIKTFMTLCMIYNLNITMVRELRHAFGYDFNTRNRVHQAYIYLLMNCIGKSLSYCNEMLKVLDIEEKDYLGNGEINVEDIEIDILGETK